jgi:hypothetical protein
MRMENIFRILFIEKSLHKKIVNIVSSRTNQNYVIGRGNYESSWKN